MASVFESNSHFEYLRERLKRGNSERGSKAKLASFIRVNPAFLSQVLSEKNSLSLEHADLANQFFDHSSEEANYFLLLVSRDKSGTTSLRKYYDDQIQIVQKKRSLVHERLGKKQQISEDVKGVYYSSWIYPTIHLICSIEGLNTRRLIAEKMALPLALVGNVLDFLEDNQLLIKSGDAYQLTQSWIRLEGDSPHLVKHHSSWRQKAIQNLEVRTEKDFHYSGIYSINSKMAQKLKDKLLDFLKEEMPHIEAAKSEDLYVLDMDLFKLT